MQFRIRIYKYQIYLQDSLMIRLHKNDPTFLRAKLDCDIQNYLNTPSISVLLFYTLMINILIYILSWILLKKIID